MKRALCISKITILVLAYPAWSMNNTFSLVYFFGIDDVITNKKSLCYFIYIFPPFNVNSIRKFKIIMEIRLGFENGIINN